MTKRRFRQIRLATNAEIAAIASPALAERLFVDVDNNQLYYIDESGTPRSIQGTGSGATNLAVANNTSTTLDVTSDTGTDATIPSAKAGSTAGLMTAADKTKLDGVATGATANSSDATLLDRANHTGTQAISTVTGLQIELDNKAALSHTHTASDITDFDTEVTNNTTVAANATKLAGIEAGAEVNNISDANATDLTDGGNSSLHYHSADRNRANHTGTQTASTISDFDTEVSNNASVTANTAKVSADGSINTHSDVDTSGASAGDVLRYDGTDWVPYTKGFISVRNGTATGTTAIGTTDKTLVLDTTNRTTGASDFTVASNEITFSRDMTAEAYYTASMNDTSAAGRSNVECRLQIWTGAAWFTVNGTISNGYIRTTGDGSTCAGSIIRDFSTGYKLRIVAKITNGSTTSAFQENAGTCLNIKEVL